MRSMTGFGRGEARDDGVTWVVECSSVNRKQLEVAINLPRELAEMEAAVRNQVAAAVSRGRINVVIRSEDTARTASVPRIDAEAAAQHLQALRALAAGLGLPAEVSLAELVRLPGVIAQDQESTIPPSAQAVITQALEAALAQMVQMRTSEGAHLREDIEARLAVIAGLLSDIRTLAPQVPVLQRQLLRDRLEQAGLPLPLDDERLVREIALFADRTDISEETARADSHLKKFRAFLSAQEPVGRSLDFLIQEFFREFNTMGAKANHAEIAHHVVAAKTELEKIREQLQNVE